MLPHYCGGHSLQQSPTCPIQVCDNQFLCPFYLPLNARCLTGRTCKWSYQKWFFSIPESN